MSHGESVERATQWLQELINEIPGLRNATSRDPGFKNWRQNAITALQRIWPTSQDHAERFRRIPFSPVDPRADVRLQRESFSRGCQEAARVLNSFIEEIRANGVPDLPSGDALPTEESGLEDGFPTVDLPGGDLHGSGTALSPAEIEQLPPQGSDPSFLPPSRLHIDTPPEGTALPKHHSTPPSDARQKRKGLGVAAKLRDLLGLTGFGEKATPPAPPQVTGNSSLTQLPPRGLDIIPVGDEVDTRPRSKAWPVPQQPKPGAPHAQSAASSPAAPEPPGPAPAKGSAPPAEAGMSVVMSRPTTLRANIEKVSIESLISPEFRGGTEDNAASKAAATPSAAPPAAAAPSAPAATPPPAEAAAPPAAGRPPLSIVPPLSGDPEFNVPTPPASEPATETPAAAHKKIVPLPLPPVPSDVEPESDPEADADDDTPIHRANSAELSRATADFMRTSPVLGATGRKVQRAPHEPSEHGYTDPDAIAIASMFDELAALGVPTSRQSEARARLLDLARRIEAEDLPWNALRKAVWFAMEYPEVARRLIPMLLPWIDRAA